MALWSCAPGVGMANVTIPHQGGQRDNRGDPVQPGVDHAWDPSPLRPQRHFGLGLVLTALWTPTATLCSGRWWLLGARVRLAGSVLCVAAHALLDAHRARAPFLDTDPREGKAGPSWHWLAVQTGKAPIQAVGVLACCGDPHCIARQEVERLGTVPMLTAAAPPPHRPWHGLGEQARHGAIAAPLAGPAGQAPHGDASGHDQQGACDPPEVAEGRRRHRGSETLEQCSHVHTGLLRRLRVAVVVDDNSSIVLRQKPFQVHAFWRRY
jgi:hypothetical protein